MDKIDQEQFDALRGIIYGIALACLLFLGYIEYNTVRDSMLQSMLEDEYAYDYACSQSSQIIKKAEYGENAYISKTVWVICEGEIEGLGNFKRPMDVEKSYSKPNAYDGYDVYGVSAPASWTRNAHERVLSVLYSNSKRASASDEGLMTQASLIRFAWKPVAMPIVDKNRISL